MGSGSLSTAVVRMVTVARVGGPGGSMVVSPGVTTAAGEDVLSWSGPMVSVTVSMTVSVLSPQTVGTPVVSGVLDVSGVSGVAGVLVAVGGTTMVTVVSLP